MNPHVNELSYRTIGAAMEVHRTLGPDCLSPVIASVSAENSCCVVLVFDENVDCLCNTKVYGSPVVTESMSWLPISSLSRLRRWRT